MKQALSFLSGILTGALVGATVAILFAPASGDELRGQLRDRAESIRSDVAHAAQARRHELERQLAQLRSPHAPE